MKPRYSKHRNMALTIVEVLVVIAVLAVATAALLSALAAAKRKPQKVNCVNNLKQVILAFKMWSSDQTDNYPMQVSSANGGTKEFIETGNVISTFQIMSNELSTPILLACPNDSKHFRATDFSSTAFTAKNISYFVGVDATEKNPQNVLVGDDNFIIDRVPAKSGVVRLSTNIFIRWSSERHVSPDSHFWTAPAEKYIGNIGFVDGSVQQDSSSQLQQTFQQGDLATNRLAIP